MSTTKKAVSKLTAKEALAELETMKDTVDFGGATFDDTTKLADLRKAVGAGRAALKDAEKAAKEAGEGAGDNENLAGDEEADLEDAESVDVVNGDRYIRTFCEAVHGEDFLESARAYVEKHGGSLTASENVTKVTVRWEQEDKKTGVVAPLFKSFEGSSFEAKEEALALANEKRGQVLVKK